MSTEFGKFLIFSIFHTFFGCSYREAAMRYIFMREDLQVAANTYVAPR